MMALSMQHVIGTLGIIINTDKIKTAPTQWSDLLKPEYKTASVLLTRLFPAPLT